MVSIETLMTAEEFALLPDPPDGSRMELVDGRVVTMAPPAGGHGRRSLKIGRRIAEFIERHKLGEAFTGSGFRLTPDGHSVRAPDVAFLAASEVPPGGISDVGYVPGPPTLAIEIVSPNDLDRDVGEKAEEYLRAGSARVWLVRPTSRTVTVIRTGGDAHIYEIDATLTSDDAGFAVDGFELPLREIFG